MGLEVRVSIDGSSRTVSLDRFLRVGSAKECDVQIDQEGLSDVSLMLVNEGVKGVRAIVKSDGVRLNGQPQTAGKSAFLQPGADFQVGSALLSLVSAASATPVANAAAVAAPQARVPLPQQSAPIERFGSRGESRAGNAAEEEEPAPKKSLKSALDVLLMVLAGVVVVAVIASKMIGDQPADTAPIPTRPFTHEIELVRNMEETWPLHSLTKEQMIERLRNAYQLVQRQQDSKAKRVIDETRRLMIKDVPTDETGRLIGHPVEDEQKAPSITERWFPDPTVREIYEFLSEQSAKISST